MPPATREDGKQQQQQQQHQQQLRSPAPPPRYSAPSSSSSSSSSTGSLTAQERLAAYKTTMGRRSASAGSGSASASSKKKQKIKELYTESRAKTLVPLLALQAFHLPGNSWCQDWIQYMTNNHPVFGICCHHPLHPIGSCTRVVALLGSIIFGLALTNLFYLFFLLNPAFNQTLFVVQAFGDEWPLTTGMLLLWTIGGSVHAGYNLVMWHIAACACCRTGGCFEGSSILVACCPSLGKRLIRVFLLISIAFGAMVVLLRIGIAHNNTNSSSSSSSSNNQEEDDQGGISVVEEWNFEVGEAEEFNFLVGYLVEMVLALFIYYPLGGTILFSGCLGCGCIPVLGGRPFEVAAEERYCKRRREQQQQQQQQQLRTNPTGETTTTLASTTSVTRGGGNVDVEVANEQDIELHWTPQAARDFERR
jgi:hypothetical protein